jgi:hypothetical protein
MLRIFFFLLFYTTSMFVLVREVSCEQQIFRSSLLIQLANLCVLVGELSPLTFSVNIEELYGNSDSLML